MLNSSLQKKRAVGFFLLVILLGLFLWFNRIPKLDTVEADLVAATAPAVECFQGLCLDGDPDSTLLSRWWEFSLTYLKLVTLGMIFAFLIAGLTEVFLFPRGSQSAWSQRGLKGVLRGLAVGPAMNLCSACIVPISTAFRRRGASIETTLTIVQGSSTLNVPALFMAMLVFTPVLAGSRIGLSLAGVLLLGPLAAFLAGQHKQPPPEPLQLDVTPEPSQVSWGEVLPSGLRNWLLASIGYLIRLGPIMVLAGFASGFAIQWVSPETVDAYLGNNISGVAVAATLGILINVPLLFEIPLVAALLLLGMGTAPAATLLFVAAAGGPITFWGLAKVIPKKAVLTFATATWSLGAIAGLGILAFGLLFSGSGSGVIRLVEAAESNCPACVLQEAIEAADDGATIEIPAGTYTLTDGELVINKDLTLIGAGASATIIEAAARPGAASHRVLRVPFGRSVTISGVTIRHGVANSTDARHVVFPGTIGGIPNINLEFGGGIHVHGTLELSGVIVRKNHAGGGGVIFNGGTLNLRDSTIADNSAEGGGGGIFNGGVLSVENVVFRHNQSGSGGGINNWGELTMVSSTIAGNKVKIGGGGLLNTSVGVSNLDSVTINGNSASGGGGIRNRGTLTLDNSTVTENSAIRGAGIQNWNTLRVTHSTVKSNRAKLNGGGISVKLMVTAPVTELRGTILADNAALSAPDCSGIVTSLGNNLLGNNSECAFEPARDDLVGTPAQPVNPMLAPLQDNGGPTETHALLPGSPAIDAGGGKSAPDTDQRGIARPQGAAADMGSYEQES